MSMSPWIAIGLGGALGAMSRYGISLGFLQLDSQTGFPLATLLINILGCFLIGWAYQYSLNHEVGIWLPFLTVGLLGGFTTFSTFGLDAIQLFQNKQFTFLVIYILLSNIIGFIAVFGGMKFSKLVFNA